MYPASVPTILFGALGAKPLVGLILNCPALLSLHDISSTLVSINLVAYHVLPHLIGVLSGIPTLASSLDERNNHSVDGLLSAPPPTCSPPPHGIS